MTSQNTTDSGRVLTAPSLGEMARVPILTDEQRTAGALRSLQVRLARAALKADLATYGAEFFAAAWACLDAVPAMQGMKVYTLLCALPGVGPKKAARLCQTAGIPLDRKVQGCGVHQRDKLFILLAKL
jgi:hypothetical protein